MAIYLLSIYIALIFIRPMDWWEPVLNIELVTGAAAATIFVSASAIMSRLPMLWRQVPPIRMAGFMLVGVTLSWAWPLWFTMLSDSFQEFGKIVILFYLIIILSKTQKDFRIILWTVLLCTAWMALHGILMGHGARVDGYNARGFGPALPRWRPSQRLGAAEDAGVWQTVAYGIFEDPNDLCLVFIIAIPLLYAEFRASQNPMLRIICITLIPLNVYAAWFTNSRGGLMGVFGMVSAYIIGRLQGLKRWLMVAFSVSLVTVGAPARGSELGIIDKERLVLWGDGLDAFRSSPLIGWGFKNFSSVSDGHAAHNSYIHCLAELGLFGYIPFIMLLTLTVTYVRRAASLKSRIHQTDQTYLVGLFSAIIGYLTSIYFLSRSYSHVLYVLLGLAISKVIMSCRDAETFQLIFGSYKQDIKRGLYFAFGSIPFIWMTVRLGYRLSS